MAEFRLKQQASSTTNGGTQDYTVTGFGTPVAAMFFATFATTAGTVRSHAGFSVGATDGTRQWSCWNGEDDNVAASATGHYNSDTQCFSWTENGTGATIRFTFNAWITDGIRVNVAVAGGAPTAPLVTCLLIGGSGVSNAYVGTTITPSTIDTGTDVTAPGFQPDAVIVSAPLNGAGTFDESATSVAMNTLGIVQRASSNPHPQYCTVYRSNDAANPTDISGLVSSNRCCVRLSIAADSAVELQDFDSSGFSAFLRDRNGQAMTIGYCAIKLSGLTAKAMAINSPTASGSQSITGIGFTPQFGMLLQNDLTAYDSLTSATNGEVFGVGLMTASEQASHSIAVDDGVTPSNAESYTDTDPVLLRKDNGVFMDATFTSFSSDTATFNYATANGTARKWAALFVAAGGPVTVALSGSAATGGSGTASPNFQIPL